MLAVGGARGEPLIPGLHIWHVGALEAETEIAVERGAGGDVGEREMVAGEVGLAREMRVEQAIVVRSGLHVPTDARPVVLVVGRPVIAPEQLHEITLQRDRGPVHPAIDERAPRGVARPQRVVAVARREIAQDRVGFPHHEAIVVDHGDPPVRIHGEERGIVQSAECAAGVDVGVWQAELADEPQGLLHVERAAASPDAEHLSSPAKRGRLHECRPPHSA